LERLAKNKSIADSYRQTMQKRQGQVCKVYTVKVQKNRLNKVQAETLKMQFVEAKWLYNYILNKSMEGDINIFKADYKDFKKITHLDKDHNEVEVDISFLDCQGMQSLITSIQSSIKTLHKLKASGSKVGKLKFKTDWTSLNIKQFGEDKIRSKNKVKVPGIRKELKVNGLDQILNSRYGKLDIANAKLIKKNDDYYVAITCFIDKDVYERLNDKSRTLYKEIVGIDFGCQSSLTFSDGRKVNLSVEETEHIKRLQRKLCRQQKGSSNRQRTIMKIRKEYEKIDNKKKDLANKTVHGIFEGYGQVCIQDEQLNKWKSQHGKKVQHSCLGLVKQRLINNGAFVIHKYVPTTKICLECGHVVEDMKLFDRTFKCPVCGSTLDRDVHAAQNMVWYHQHKETIGVERTKFKRLDFKSQMANLFGHDVYEGFKVEDARSSAEH